MPKMLVQSLSTWSVDRKGNLIAETSTFSIGDTVGIIAHVEDEFGNPLSGAQVFMELVEPGIALQGFSDIDGDAIMTWKTPRKNAPATVTANVLGVIKNNYEFKCLETVKPVIIKTCVNYINSRWFNVFFKPSIRPKILRN